jgi:hypothetical protein
MRGGFGGKKKAQAPVPGPKRPPGPSPRQQALIDAENQRIIQQAAARSIDKNSYAWSEKDKQGVIIEKRNPISSSGVPRTSGGPGRYQQPDGAFMSGVHTYSAVNGLGGLFF